MMRTFRKSFICMFLIGVFAMLMPVFAHAEGAVEITELRQAGKDYARLSWTAVDDAEGYMLYRADDDGARRLIKSVRETECFNYGLVNGTDYTYFVRPYALDADGNRIYGTFSEGSTIHFGLIAPTITAAELKSASSAQITWSADPLADGQILYRSTDGESWTLVKRVSGSETVTCGLQSDQTSYYFRVKSYRTTDSVERYSDYSAVWCLPMCPGCPEGLKAELAASSYAHLTWDAVDGASAYRIYRSIDGGPFALLKTVTGTETYNYSLTAEHTYAYCVASVAQIGSTSIRSDLSEHVMLINQLQRPGAPEVTYASANSAALKWPAVDGATGYRLYRSHGSDVPTLVKTVSGTETVTYGLAEGEIYAFSIRPIHVGEGYTVSGGTSLPATYIHQSTDPHYRAILIGEHAYVDPLDGPENDIARMETLLGGMSSMSWEIYSQPDVTKKEISSMVNLIAQDSSAEDVTLFFYSGHGVTDSTDYYQGALVTVDYDYIPTQELAKMLSAIPGRVIVILDCCGSGAAISDGSSQQKAKNKAAADAFSPAQFNESVIQAFASLDAVQIKSAELRKEKYYVITASAYNEISYSVGMNDIWGGALTREITASAGLDFNTQAWSETMPGDTNQDQLLSIGECYGYCSEHVTNQNVLIYPEGSQFPFLIR